MKRERERARARESREKETRESGDATADRAKDDMYLFFCGFFFATSKMCVIFSFHVI